MRHGKFNFKKTMIYLCGGLVSFSIFAMAAEKANLTTEKYPNVPSQNIQPMLDTLQKQIIQVNNKIPLEVQAQAKLTQKELLFLQQSFQKQFGLLQNQIHQLQSQMVQQVNALQKQLNAIAVKK